jgi:hypothetical protein
MAVKTFTSATLSSADTNTYLANSGLVYITEGTNTANLSFNNCFSNSFLNYRVVGQITASQFANRIGYRYRVSGGDISSPSTYQWAFTNIFLSGGTPGQSAQGTQNTSIAYIGYKSATANHSTSFVIDFFNPFSTTGWKTATHQSTNANAAIDVANGGSTYQATTSYDGFSLISESGTMTISAKIYGYRQA